MGTHPIFESDFDCLTDLSSCFGIQIHCKMAKKESPKEMQSKLTAKLQSLKEPEASPVSPPISYRTRNKKSSQSRIPVRASPEKSAKLETLIPDPAESAAGDAPNTESVTVSTEAVPDGAVLGEPPVDETEPEDPEPEIEALETPLEQNNNKTEQNAEEVSELTNEQLRERLSSYGIAIGPVVETTRKFYEKKLAKIMTESAQAYSTDEEGGAPVGAVAEPLPQKEAKPAKKTRTRAKREPEVVQDKFSDDEEDIPVVKNTSSARRRSARIQVKKSTEKVAVEEPIVEEKEEPVEAEVAVVENGSAEPAPVAEEETAPEVEEVVEEDSVETEQESQESVEQAPTAKRPIPYHTIVVVLLVSMALALLWKEREQHVAICGSVLSWVQTEYSKLYDSLMPDVEQLPPQSEQ